MNGENSSWIDEAETINRWLREWWEITHRPGDPFIRPTPGGTGIEASPMVWLVVGGVIVALVLVVVYR